MRIGYDASQTGNLKAGCGYFADTLIRTLAHLDRVNEYRLYPTFGDIYWDPDWESGVRRISGANFQMGNGQKSLEALQGFWMNPPDDLENRMGNPDLIHSNNFFCPTTLAHARLVYTLYDLSFLIHPEWTTEKNRTSCFQGVFNASTHADWILAISQYSRASFLDFFPHYPPERVTVAYPASRFADGLPSSRIQPPQGLFPQKFWLNVGSLEPRKNHQGLLKAYVRLKKEGRTDYPLVLAGGKGWLMEDFEKVVAESDRNKDVIFLGYTDDETLRWLYENCFALVYPTFFEGFGLPILEAMSLKAPVIASGVTSIPELVQDAALLVDPQDESQLYRAMRKLSEDENLRRLLKEKGFEQSRRFSWETTASRVLECYREVMARKPLFSGA